MRSRPIHVKFCDGEKSILEVLTDLHKKVGWYVLCLYVCMHMRLASAWAGGRISFMYPAFRSLSLVVQSSVNMNIPSPKIGAI
jgi:hypothetical protein